MLRDDFIDDDDLKVPRAIGESPVQLPLEKTGKVFKQEEEKIVKKAKNVLRSKYYLRLML